MVFFFPASSSDVLPLVLVQNMTSALAQTFKAIPLLAGTITSLPDGSQSGRLAVTAPWRTAEDALVEQDLRETDYPSYEVLRSKHFPMIDINYNILMPTRRSLYTRALETDERPVLLAQINFIKGGMILGLIIDHAFTDGGGYLTIARVWATFCRGEDGSLLVSPDLIDRTPLMKGDESARLEDFKEYVYYEPKLLTPTPAIELNPDPLAVEIFFFPKARLRELKETVSKQLDSDETCWISTNDALASLIWCCVTAAHKTDIHNGSNDLSSLLAFFIDARRFTKPPLPARFIGNAFIRGSLIEPFSTLLPTVQGVAECAHSLRRKIKQYSNDDTYLPRLIGAVASVPDVRRVRLDRMRFDKRSLLVNSWVAQDYYDIDWGRLAGGRCERVRTHRPQLANFCLVLPELMGSEAGLEVVVSVKAHHMEVLRENELFNRFAEWRCS